MVAGSPKLVCPISHLLVDRITLTHYSRSTDPGATTDALGNPIRIETQSEIPASIQQVSGTTGANGATYTARCYLCPGAVVAEDDKIDTPRKTYWVNAVQYHRAPRITAPAYIGLELRETLERVNKIVGGY